MEHIDWVWLNERLNQLELLSKRILQKLEGGGTISPELESSWKKLKIAILVVDRKVSDKKTSKQGEQK